VKLKCIQRLEHTDSRKP